MGSVDGVQLGGLLADQLACALVTSDFDPWADQTHGSPMWRLSPELCLPETQPWAPRRGPLSLLVPRVPLPEGLLPKGPAPEDGSSNLTHGR